MPKVIQIEHPDLDGYVEVNDDTLDSWEAVGWHVVAKDARAASAPSRKKQAAPTKVEEGE